jgi:CRISPR/Cas system Type II protein with McrA/HNH and RuvC-like nuclease domain
MKNKELETLIKGIVRNILKEYTSLSSSDVQQLANADPSLNPSVPPTDAQTPAEKARMEREAELARQKDIKQKQSELDSKKKEMEFNKKKLDQQKRFEVPTLNKDLQQLKGAKLQ